MSGAVEGVALRKIIRDMLDGKAGARDAARQVLTTPPARSYVDGVADERARIITRAKRNLALTQGCMECNADDDRRWADTIRWLEENA